MAFSAQAASVHDKKKGKNNTCYLSFFFGRGVVNTQTTVLCSFL